VATGRAETNPAHRQPKRRVSKPKDRVLNDDEPRRVWLALDTKGSRQMARAIKLLIVTGARVNEVIAAAKPEIKGDIWIKPAVRMKNNAPHAVPLTSAALILFQEASEASDSDNIVEGRTGKEAFDSHACSRAVLRIMADLKIDARAHDFRRPLSSQMAHRAQCPHFQLWRGQCDANRPHRASKSACQGDAGLAPAPRVTPSGPSCKRPRLSQ
jgi:integrase